MARIFKGLDQLARLDRQADTMTRFEGIRFMARVDQQLIALTITKAGLFGFYAAAKVDGIVTSEYGKSASHAAVKLVKRFAAMREVQPVISLDTALDRAA